MKSLTLNIIRTAIFLSFISTVHAIPTLQIYMEGATYDKGNTPPPNVQALGAWSGGVYDVVLAIYGKRRMS